jgi:hypothetical protein
MSRGWRAAHGDKLAVLRLETYLVSISDMKSIAFLMS